MPPDDQTRKLGDIAAAAGLHRVHIVAWRDLDDVEAGGSELHASMVAKLWAEAGIDVTMRTSWAQGHPPRVVRDGYHVYRKGGRYLVFPRSAAAEMLGHHGARDGFVEIWNGMPFFSPLWVRGPRVVWLHHVHGEMWRMALGEGRGRMGEILERRVAPLFYRRSSIVTLSESSRREIVHDLHLPAKRVTVVPPGIDPRFHPATTPKADHPLVVAVGRLVPSKRFDLLVDALIRLRQTHPRLRAVIVGEGYERIALEARIHAADADDWLLLPGHVSDDELIDLYRRAWVVAASSIREGWGMTLTEAAACGTPGVATRIAGHADAVIDGVTGLLVEPADLGDALDRVLGDDRLRDRLGGAAIERAAALTWEATAVGTLEVLAGETRRRSA